MKTLLVSSVLGLGLSVSLSGADCVAPPAGQTHWWAGHNSPADWVGTAHGTLSGSASYAPGLAGEAFNLGGDGGHVEVPLDAPTGAYTFEAWVKFTGASFQRGNNFNTIFEFGTDSPTMGVRQDGTLDMWSTVAGGHLEPGQWSHVAYTWDGTNSRLYVNGVQVAANTTAPRTGGSGLGLGYHVGDTGWLGMIDEAGLYNRALNDAEIQDIFNAGAAGKVPAQHPGSACPGRGPVFLKFRVRHGDRMDHAGGERFFPHVYHLSRPVWQWQHGAASEEPPSRQDLPAVI